MMTQPNYDITRTIGSGAFGYVFEAIDRNTGRKVALKRIEKVEKGMSRENQILTMLKGCPHIIQIQNLFYSETEKGKLVQNIVFEYLDDNLENVIQIHKKKEKFIEESQIKRYMYQLLRGLVYIHEKKIAHRDLKPENILLNKNGQVKICDFGCSKIIDPKGVNTPYVMSRCYRAPQLIMGITKYSINVDLWSVGCIMAELALLEPIFVGKDEGDQLFAILQIRGSFSEKEEKQFMKRVPFEAELFKSFRGFEPINFWKKFNMIKEIQNFLDLLAKLLEYLPQKRISAVQALNHPYFNSIKSSF